MYTVVWYDQVNDLTIEEVYLTLVSAQVRFNALQPIVDNMHLWIECRVQESN